MRELKDKTVITRKSHRCEWCAEVIEAGHQAKYRAYVFDSELCAGWQHPECYAAMLETDEYVLDEGWLPGDFRRGKNGNESCPKPCPFCSGKKILIEFNRPASAGYAYCANCRAQGPETDSNLSGFKTTEHVERIWASWDFRQKLKD